MIQRDYKMKNKKKKTNFCIILLYLFNDLLVKNIGKN